MKRTLTVTCLGDDGELLPGAIVRARLVDSRGRPTTDYTTDGVVLTTGSDATADEDGIAELSLVPNTLGTQDSRYRIEVYQPDAGALVLRRGDGLPTLIQMPDADATLQQLVEEQPVTDATQTAAAVSAHYAELWATHDPQQPVPDPPGDGELLSARGYAVLAGEIVAAAVSDIAQARDQGIDAVIDARDTALQQLDSARSSALSQISDDRDGALQAIEDARTAAVEQIQQLVEQAQQAAQTSTENAQQTTADQQATQQARQEVEGLYGDLQAIDEAVLLTYANRAYVDTAIANNLVILEGAA